MRRRSLSLSLADVAASESHHDAVFELLAEARARGATDVHLLPGSPVTIRVDGSLVAMDERPLTHDDLAPMIAALLTEADVAQLDEQRDVDVLRVDTAGGRHRVNVAYTRDRIGAVIRLLPAGPRPLESLHLPPIVEELTQREKGLILITGSTSMGKTTTMASFIDKINRTEGRHIITIEDPIEYVHVNDRALIRQREVGRDVRSFAEGLRAALRQDPDVILIGEMRDYETIEIALRAAEAGALVISTLHVVSIERLVDRLISFCPPGREALMRSMLSETLLAAIHQELLPTVDGGKRVACEILVATRAVRHLLRTGSELQLRNALQTGMARGMQEMETSLNELVADGAITDEVADRVMRNYKALS